LKLFIKSNFDKSVLNSKPILIINMVKHYKKKRAAMKRSKRRSKNAPLANRLKYFKHKCTGVIALKSANPEQDSITAVFARYDYEGLIANVYGINSTARFNQVKRNYEQYKVDGFSFKFIPTNIEGISDTNDGSKVSG